MTSQPSTQPTSNNPTTAAPPPLPTPFQTTTTPLSPLTQGAEAHLYKTTFLTPSTLCALKIRPKKTWRHPTLDRRLTRSRILAEARVLAKCRREGVLVPAVLGMSWEEGWIALEWVDGKMVKEVLRGRVVEDGVKGLLGKVGRAVGKLHSIGVVHGDLTTSNMLVRLTIASGSGSGSGGEDGEIVLIDFGLATQTVADEDRAVDLYVLERAFGSTHPREEELFPLVLEAYAGSYKGAKAALKRLEDVRMRGRKKSMLG